MGRKKGLRFFGNVSGMIVQDDPNGAVRRIPGVQVLEQSGEFDAAMTALYPGGNVTVVEIQSRQNGASSQALILMVTADFWMFAGYGR